MIGRLSAVFYSIAYKMHCRFLDEFYRVDSDSSPAVFLCAANFKKVG